MYESFFGGKGAVWIQIKWLEGEVKKVTEGYACSPESREKEA